MFYLGFHLLLVWSAYLQRMLSYPVRPSWWVGLRAVVVQTVPSPENVWWVGPVIAWIRPAASGTPKVSRSAGAREWGGVIELWPVKPFETVTVIEGFANKVDLTTGIHWRQTLGMVGGNLCRNFGCALVFFTFSVVCRCIQWVNLRS